MKRVIFSALLLPVYLIISAQVPQGFNYQAVARTTSGGPISNTTIQAKIGILSDTLTPVIIWEELHSTVKTDASGIFNLVIGTGTKQSGSAPGFSAVDWTKTPLYIRIQIYYQSSWKNLGNAKLWTVPYSMVAGNLSGSVKKLAIIGETTDLEEPLFEIRNKDGQTVFAVYNEGVRIYVDNGSKSSKGGFTVGGFGTSKAPSQNLLVVNNDSIRAYIDTNTGKGVKGGFAVGGFDNTKASYQDLLVVNADSIRAYIDHYTGKGTKGGFAVGGFNTGKTPGQEYLRVTRDSTMVYFDNSATKGMKGGFAVGGFDASKGLSDNYMLINPDSTRFYVHQIDSGYSSTFNIIGISLDQVQTSLLSANTDTVGIAGVLNVQNNIQVLGNINYTGQVNMIVPEVQTLEPMNVADISAVCGGTIVSDGGAVVIESGICWSTSPNPTVKLTTKTIDGTLTGQFTSTIIGLTPGTTYYVRAYATNANGTGYGNEMEITTLSAGNTILDYDGNVYNVVFIGTQAWLASNLKTTHLNDGTLIPNVTDTTTWINLSTPGYSWYNHDAVTYADYGPLYNWATVNTGTLCPTGWHVPSEEEGNVMMAFLGGSFVAGGKLKEAGTTHWLSPNTDATNETGFTALPGGMRSYMGFFTGIGENGFYWSSTRISTDPSMAVLFYSTAEMFFQTMMQNAGQSVRCLKN